MAVGRGLWYAARQTAWQGNGRPQQRQTVSPRLKRANPAFLFASFTCPGLLRGGAGPAALPGSGPSLAAEGALPPRKAGPAEHAGSRSLAGAAGRAAILCAAADPVARSPRQSPPSVGGSGLPDGSGRCSPSLSGPGAAEAVPVGNEIAAETLPPWRRSHHPYLRLDLPPVMHGASPA